MFARLRRLRRPALALAISCVSIAGTVALPSPAGAAAQPVFLGPLLSRAETASMAWGRDGGFSVGLPNGKDFWIFGDTPRYQFQDGAWTLTGFIEGSTAAQESFTPGKPLTAPLDEINLGHKTTATNKPRQFLPAPSLYMPDGTGRACTKANGGSKVEPVRWATGATMMPDKTNILIPYTSVCVINETRYVPEGWGFALYNWKTNRFSMPPFEVFKATPNGAATSTSQLFGSPVIKNGKVSFYSWTCCSPGSVYVTTVALNLTALKNPSSYVPKVVPDVLATFNSHVAPPSQTHSRITMYSLRNDKGDYIIYAATNPAGPWTQVASGTLPRCSTSPRGCNSFALHPELSPSGRLIVSYHLPGFGPGIATKHPYPHLPLNHVVTASIPCNC